MATQVVREGIVISGSISSLTEKVIDLQNVRSLSVYAKYTKAVETGKTFVVLSLVDNTLTVTGHGWATGRKGQATNVGGVLPSGMSLLTDYFVIAVDADTIKLASSLANALVGTAIDVTGNGTGVHTFTPTALAGGVVNVYETNDSDPLTTEWNLIASMTAAITVTGKSVFKPNADSRQAKISFDMTAGQLDVVATICAKN